MVCFFFQVDGRVLDLQLEVSAGGVVGHLDDLFGSFDGVDTGHLGEFLGIGDREHQLAGGVPFSTFPRDATTEVAAGEAGLSIEPVSLIADGRSPLVVDIVLRDEDGKKRPLREIEPDGVVRPVGTDDDVEEEVRRPIEHPPKDAPGF